MTTNFTNFVWTTALLPSAKEGGKGTTVWSCGQLELTGREFGSLQDKLQLFKDSAISGASRFIGKPINEIVLDDLRMDENAFADEIKKHSPECFSYVHNLGLEASTRPYQTFLESLLEVDLETGSSAIFGFQQVAGGFTNKELQEMTFEVFQGFLLGLITADTLREVKEKALAVEEKNGLKPDGRLILKAKKK